MELEATGALFPARVDGAEALELALSSHDRSVLIVPGSEQGTRDRFAELQSLASQGASVRVRGRLHTHAGGPHAAMSASSFQEVEPVR